MRLIGVTGHGAQIAATHRRSLERFDFDSVLLPYNFVTMQNRTTRQFQRSVQDLPERQVAVQTIKSIGCGHGRAPAHRATWYEPLEQQGDIDLAVWWALSRPGVFLCSAGDLDLLPRVLDAASRFTGAAPDDATMSGLASRTSAEPLFV